jgi:hypothetical protein
VPPKPTLFFWPLGDRSVPNPEEQDLIRAAAGPLTSSILYRTDLAATAAQAIGETLPANYNPHQFIEDVLTDRTTTLVAKTAQQQLTGFFTVDGASLIDLNTILAGTFPVPLRVKLFEATVPVQP